MAKKKKKTGLAAKPQASTPGDASTFFLWVAALGGALLLLAFLAVPWVTVLASAKNGVALLGEAIGKEKSIASALAFVLLPALAAIALPFLPPSQPLREAAATGTGVMTMIAGLIVAIVSWSSRNLLAFGAGRQNAEPGLLFIALAFVLGGSVGYLVLCDNKDETQSRGVAWYGLFVAVLVAILIFNYGVIPDSIIPPPDFIRQRLGWMD